MKILTFGADDHDIIAAAYDVVTVAEAADTPENPPTPRTYFAGLIRHGRPAREHHWFAAKEDNRVVGYMEVWFWTDSNPHLAGIEGSVHPDYRRRGIGTALLERAIATIRTRGRNTIITGTPIAWENGPARSEDGARFLEEHGFTRALTTVNRRSFLDALDPAEEARLYAEAEAAAGDDYELRQWVGRTPDDLLISLARMTSTINEEIPLGELEFEREEVDVEKLRAREDLVEADGFANVNTVAVHRESDEIVAHTSVFASRDESLDAAFQGITIVAPDHRGHRLGLLLKLANLRQIREQLGHIKSIWTDNADVNAHMIAINETLGYETVDAAAEYQRKLED